MPFPKPTLAVETSDGRTIKLLEPLEYISERGERIIVPAGAQSDGASTPREIWPAFPPFGKYWLAAVLHDYLYRQTSRPKAECDSLFKEAMHSLGVDLLTRETIYEGVHLAGKAAFDEDRKAFAE